MEPCHMYEGVTSHSCAFVEGAASIETFIQIMPNTQQHTATRCNTLPHTTHMEESCLTHVPLWEGRRMNHSFKLCPTHCNTPQHTATHCNTYAGVMSHLFAFVGGASNETFISDDLCHTFVWFIYGVATISRLLKMIGLVCRISSLL